MNQKNPLLLSLLHALAIIGYIILVVFLINSMSVLFEDTPDDFWTPVLMLMLFVVSAAITGALILGRPIFMYLNEQKKEGILFLSYTITWLFVIMLISFASYIVFK